MDAARSEGRRRAAAPVVMTLALSDATGAARMACHFANALIRGGHPVTLIAGPPPASGDSILPEMRSVGVTVQSEPGLARPTPAVVQRVVETAGRVDAGAIIGIMQRDRVVALRAAHRARLPCVISAQNQHVFWGPWPVRTLKRLLYRQLISRHATLVACTSEAVQREVIHSFGVAPVRTTVLPNGVAMDQLPAVSPEHREWLRAELNVRPDESLVLNIGRLDFQKGQDLLLQAFARVAVAHSSAKLVLVGGATGGTNAERSQEYAAGLRRTTAELGLAGRVIFAGWRSDVPALLRASDVYVHSARWEGWPLALVEAMAAERPVVATDCAGRPTGFVDGQHGWIVATGDVTALETGMLRLLALDRGGRLRMGEAARRLAVAEYDAATIGRRFVALVESVI